MITATIKWVILMTYLVTRSLDTSTESPSNCMTYEEIPSIECVRGAIPEPVTYFSVTKFVGKPYDTREECQDVIDATMLTYTNVIEKNRLYRGMILQCKRARVRIQ